MTTHSGDHPTRARASGARNRVTHGRLSAPIELVRDEREEAPAWSARQAARDAAKRFMDIVLATLALVILAPVFALVALVIKIDSRGPVFFAHRRLGRNGRHFDCLKFRTMETDAEHRVFEDERLRHHYVSNHFKIPAELDPRITRVGRLLRQSSIDELPQLVNVLLGDMSLVGPRPIVSLEATHYGDEVGTLLSVRPGLTGLWAVSGRSQLGYPARANLELEYVRSRSLRGDMSILVRTPWTVLTRRGAL